MAINLGVNVQLARNWQQKVENELAEVDALLKNVGEVIATPAEEDDTIMCAISQVGRGLTEKWKSLTATFNEVNEECRRIVDRVEKAIGEGTDVIDVGRSTYGI